MARRRTSRGKPTGKAAALLILAPMAMIAVALQRSPTPPPATTPASSATIASRPAPLIQTVSLPAGEAIAAAAPPESAPVASADPRSSTIERRSGAVQSIAPRVPAGEVERPISEHRRKRRGRELFPGIAVEEQLEDHGSYINSSGKPVHAPARSKNGSAPDGATARCGDGTYSFSQHRSGTCSRHSGVVAWLR